MKQISPSVLLALIYFFFGVCWILTSDALARNIAGNNMGLLLQLQNVKGILFVALSGILLFITARRLYRHLQRSLKNSDALLLKYKAMNEAATEGVVDLNLVSGEAEVNDYLRDLMHLPESHIKNFFALHRDRIHPDDERRVAQNFWDTIDAGASLWQAEYRLLWKDGIYRNFVNRCYIVRNGEGSEPKRVICMLNDVTELRNMKAIYMEQEIRHRQHLARTIIQAQEEERNRWALELHDNVCQLLTVVKLYLEQLGTEQPSPLLQKAEHTVSRALTDIRQLSTSIKPPEFNEVSIEEAIEQLISNVRNIKPIHFATDYKGLKSGMLSYDHKMMVYRIVQEQLQNILKYAGAKNVVVKLDNNDGHVQVTVQDDGVGFDPQRVKTGIGLRNIRSRLQVFQGALNIQSAPAQGCTLLATFSVD